MSLDVGRATAGYILGTFVADVCVEPITSVQQTKDANAVIVSTLDSTIRLMDKGNGQLLQLYQGHTNKDLRIRSCMGMADSVVISGSEDGQLFAWDLLAATVIGKLQAHGGKVASAVACNGLRREWASSGADGKLWLGSAKSLCFTNTVQARSVSGGCLSDAVELSFEVTNQCTPV